MRWREERAAQGGNGRQRAALARMELPPVAAPCRPLPLPPSPPYSPATAPTRPAQCSPQSPFAAPRSPTRAATRRQSAPTPRPRGPCRAAARRPGMDHAGAVLGPIVAWWLLASGSAGLRTVIGASIVPGVLVLLLASRAVKGGAATGGMGRQQAAIPSEPMPPSAARYRLLPPALLAISFFYLLRMPDTLIILRSQQLGVPVAVVPLLWAAVHVVRSTSSFAGGAASDRLGPGQTMWLGWLAAAILAVGMARAGTAAAAWGWFLGLGLVAGLTESPERSLVARLAGAHRGSGFGVYHGVTGFAALVGGVALGAVFQRFGAGAAFLASAAGGLGLVLGWPVLARAGVWRWRGVR